MKQTNRPLTVVALLLAMFMAAMEATVVATAMPTVVADLGGLELYGWVGAVYMVANTVSIPLYGKLADLHGRRPILLLGLALFVSGSIASGLSASMFQLIAFRAIQGLGAGAMQPIALTVVGDLYRADERARVQGLFGAVWGFSGIAGPMLGSLIVDLWSWHWVFFVNVPFGILTAALLLVAYHERVAREARELDLFGALTLSFAILCILACASGVWPLLTGAAGALGLAAFIAVERRAREPVLPLSLMRRRIIATGSVSGALLGAVMMATLNYVPLFIQGVLGGTPAQAGSAITPMLVGWPLAASFSGRLLIRTGYRPLIRAGSAVVFAAAGLLVWFTVRGASLNELRVTMGLLGVGLGLANTALIIAVQESVDWAERGVATASSMFFRTIGGALAVGGLGALLAKALGPGVPAPLLNQLLQAHGRDLLPSQVHAISRALGGGLGQVFVATLWIAAAGLVAALLFPNEFAPKKATDERLVIGKRT